MSRFQHQPTRSHGTKSSSSSSGGVGFTGLLTILFIALKLTGVISWSWLWVLSPIWISLSIALVLVALVLVLSYFASK